MSKPVQPHKVFPAEVLELQKQGVPLPDWFVGPLYNGNGSSEAVAQLQTERARATQNPPESTDADAPDF